MTLPKPAPPSRRDSGFTRVHTLLAVASRMPDTYDDTSREVRSSSMALCSKLSSSVFPYFDDAEAEREYRYFSFSGGSAGGLELAHLCVLGACIFALDLLDEVLSGRLVAAPASQRALIVGLNLSFAAGALCAGGWIHLHGSSVSPSRTALLSVLVFSTAALLPSLLALSVARQTGAPPHFEATLACLAGFALLVPRVQLRFVVIGMALQACGRVAIGLCAGLLGVNVGAVLLLRCLCEEALLVCLGLGLAAPAEAHHRALFWHAKLFVRHSAAKQRKRDDVHRLLLNTLPEPIAREIGGIMIEGGSVEVAHRYAGVTVLQADLSGYTALSAKLSPEEVIVFMSDLFGRFDDLAVRHGVHKLKTIGDAYVACAGAFPGEAGPHDDAEEAGLAVDAPGEGEEAEVRARDAAVRAATMACEMVGVVADVAAERGVDISARVGVHTGGAVGGIIGTVRFHFDMWGGGVYGAMLMEEAGEPQRVHASDATAALLGERGFGLRPARKYAPPHPAAAAFISSSFWLVRSTPPPSPDGRSDGHSSASAPRAGSPHLNGPHRVQGPPTPPPSGATQATARPRRYRPLDPVTPPAAKGWGQLRGIQRGIRPGEIASLSSAVHVLGMAPPGNLSFEASSELPSLRSANWQKWHSSPVALHLRRSGFELSTPDGASQSRASTRLSSSHRGSVGGAASPAASPAGTGKRRDSVRDSARRLSSFSPFHSRSEGVTELSPLPSALPAAADGLTGLPLQQRSTQPPSPGNSEPSPGGRVPRLERRRSSHFFIPDVEEEEQAREPGAAAADSRRTSVYSPTGPEAALPKGWFFRPKRRRSDPAFWTWRQHAEERRYLEVRTLVLLGIVLVAGLYEAATFSPGNGWAQLAPLLLLRHFALVPSLMGLAAYLRAHPKGGRRFDRAAAVLLLLLPAAALAASAALSPPQNTACPGLQGGLPLPPCGGAVPTLPVRYFFDEMDRSPPDGTLSRVELREALPDLVRWGFDVNGPDDTFRNIAAFYDADSDWALDFDEFVAWVGAAGPKARSSWAAGLGCVSSRVDGTRFCNSPPVVYWTLLGMVHTLFSYSVELGTLLRRPFFLLAVAGLSAVYLSAIHTNLRVQYGGLEQQSEVLETVLEIGLWLGFAHVLGFLHYKDRRLAVWRQRCLQLREHRVLEAVKEETAHCERLLRNVLPPHLLSSLQHFESSLGESSGGRTAALIAAKHEGACFLFAKVVGLSSLVNDPAADPRLLVLLLQRVFDRFDRLADNFGVLRVRKTANEFYLAATGLAEPGQRPMDPADVGCALASFGFALVNISHLLNLELRRDGLLPAGLELRVQVGIHSGEAIAGVIGHKTFQYDLVGDAVNTAARMCSSSSPGRVLVSESTYERLLCRRFSAEPRGRSEVKGKGQMATLFLLNGPPAKTLDETLSDSDDTLSEASMASVRQM